MRGRNEFVGEGVEKEGSKERSGLYLWDIYG